MNPYDTKIIVQGETFKAHRSVLIRFSPYLKRKLIYEQGKPVIDTVEIQEIGSPEFSIILRYMYTNALDINCNNLFGIYKGAAVLQMKDLKEKCLQIIRNKQDPLKRCFYLYVSSKNLGEAESGSRAFQFLVDCFEKTICYREFVDLDVNCIVEILSAPKIGARSEILVFLAALHWLSHRYPSRKKHAAKVIKCVRFSMMTMEELTACYHPPYNSDLIEVQDVQTQMHAARCYIEARSTWQDSQLTEYAPPMRILTLRHLPIRLWHKNFPPVPVSKTSEHSNRLTPDNPFKVTDRSTRISPPAEDLKSELIDQTKIVSTKYRNNDCRENIQTQQDMLAARADLDTEMQHVSTRRHRNAEQSSMEKKYRDEDCRENIQTRRDMLAAKPDLGTEMQQVPPKQNTKRKEYRDNDRTHTVQTWRDVPVTKADPVTEMRNVYPEQSTKKYEYRDSGRTHTVQTWRDMFAIKDDLKAEIQGINPEQTIPEREEKPLKYLRAKKVAPEEVPLESVNQLSLHDTVTADTISLLSTEEFDNGELTGQAGTFWQSRNNNVVPQRGIYKDDTTALRKRIRLQSVSRQPSDIPNEPNTCQMSPGTSTSSDTISSKINNEGSKKIEALPNLISATKCKNMASLETANFQNPEYIPQIKPEHISLPKEAKLYPQKKIPVKQPNQEQPRSFSLVDIKAMTPSKHRFEKQPHILVTGGISPKDKHSVGIGSCILDLDPKKNKWIRYATIPEPRHHHAATFLDGFLYIVGGCNPENTIDLERYVATRSCFKFDTAASEWVPMADMKYKRHDHGITVYDGKLYVIGGQDESERLLKSVEVYDPKRSKKNPKWKVLSAEMCCGRKAMGVATFSGNIWVAGGLIQPNKQITLQSVSHVDCFNPREKKWMFKLFYLPSPRCYCSLVVWNGLLHCIGGVIPAEDKYKPIDEVFYLNDDSQLWEKGPFLQNPLVQSVAVVYDYNLYVIGGVNIDHDRVAPTMCLTPSAALWETRASLPSEYIGFAAVSC